MPVPRLSRAFCKEAFCLIKNKMDTFIWQSFRISSPQTSTIFAESTLGRTQFCFLSGIVLPLEPWCRSHRSARDAPRRTSPSRPGGGFHCMVLLLVGRISSLLQQIPFFYMKLGLIPNKNLYQGSKQAKQTLSKLTAGSRLIRQVQSSSIIFFFVSMHLRTSSRHYQGENKQKPCLRQ